MSTADRPTTEPHPWENHDDSCQCHITICADCGCTNEIVPAEAAQGAAPPAALDVEALRSLLVTCRGILAPKGYSGVTQRIDRALAALAHPEEEQRP